MTSQANSKTQAAPSSAKTGKLNLDNHKPALEERGKLHVLKKDIEARIKQLDEELRPILQGQGEIMYAGFTFKVDVAAGRSTVDYKQIIEDYNVTNVEDYTNVGAPSTRFTIKEVASI